MKNVNQFGKGRLFNCLVYCYRGKKIYEPPRYMSVSQAAEQLIEVVKNKTEEGHTNLGRVQPVQDGHLL